MAGSLDTHQEGSLNSNRNNMSIWRLFRYADCADVLMMVLGTLGSITDGTLGGAGVLIILSRLINSLGSDPPDSKHGDHFVNIMNKVKHLQMIYL